MRKLHDIVSFLWKVQKVEGIYDSKSIDKKVK